MPASFDLTETLADITAAVAAGEDRTVVMVFRPLADASLDIEAWQANDDLAADVAAMLGESDLKVLIPGDVNREIAASPTTAVLHTGAVIL